MVVPPEMVVFVFLTRTVDFRKTSDKIIVRSITTTIYEKDKYR